MGSIDKAKMIQSQENKKKGVATIIGLVIISIILVVVITNTDVSRKTVTPIEQAK